MMQFQMFLQQLIPAMEFGTALMTPLAVLLAILYSCDGGNLRKTFRKAAYWGFWGSVFIMAAKQGTRNAVSREGFEGLMAFFAIISELILAGVLLGSSEKFMKRLGIFKKGVKPRTQTVIKDNPVPTIVTSCCPHRGEQVDKPVRACSEQQINNWSVRYLTSPPKTTIKGD